jgi:hypothetical protein
LHLHEDLAGVPLGALRTDKQPPYRIADGAPLGNLARPACASASSRSSRCG